MKKYWFYFGIGTKKGQTVHKNGIVGADCEFCPIVDIENSVMEEDQVVQFHVASFQEVPEKMFLQFREDLKAARPVITEPEPEEKSVDDVIGPGFGGGLGMLGSLLGGIGAHTADEAEAKEVSIDEAKKDEQV